MFLAAPITTFPIDSSQFTIGNLDLLFFNIVKILFLVGFFLYILFAFLALRQIDEMRKTVVTSLSPFVQMLGFAHLLLSIAVFLFVLQYLR